MKTKTYPTHVISLIFFITFFIVSFGFGTNMFISCVIRQTLDMIGWATICYFVAAGSFCLFLFFLSIKETINIEEDTGEKLIKN